MEHINKERAREARYKRRCFLSERKNKKLLRNDALKRVTHVVSYSAVNGDTSITTTTQPRGKNQMEHITKQQAKEARYRRTCILFERKNKKLLHNGSKSRHIKHAREARQKRMDILSSRRTRSAQQHVTHIVSHSVVREDGSVTTITQPSGNHLSETIHTDIAMDDTESQGNHVEEFYFGQPDKVCSHCGAIVWYEERKNKSQGTRNPAFMFCCQDGKVQLPLLKDTPKYLKKLLDYNEDSISSRFRDNIRSYNSMFAFSSMGGHVDNTINNGTAPYIFRINGQNHHKIGSLLPTDGSTPKFAQLYIYDTANECTNRINAFANSKSTRILDRAVVEGLLKMLDENNELTKVFRMARDKYEEADYVPVSLRIIGVRQTDARQYNLPSTSEVAALIVGNGYEDNGNRDIIVEAKETGLKRITELHPSFMAMQYPLLFPYAEDGFRLNIPYRNVQNTRDRKRKFITIREYYAFRIQQRINEGQTLIRGGRLYQQFLVDAYTCIEENRLKWVRKNQQRLRVELYSGLTDAVVAGDTTPASVGKRLVLPSSFTGGPRYMVQNYQDAIAICRYAGPPDLFITFTCNPKWREIQYFLEILPGQKSEDRPEIPTRVFMIKLYHLIRDLRDNRLFGEVKAVVYTVEFQKRGLPHAHILIFLDAKHKLKDSTQIDNIVSAELPDKEIDQAGYDAVVQFMVHGKCGEGGNFKAPCLIDKKCSKHFPKKFVSQTSIDDKGYPIYRRRDNGRKALKDTYEVDNGWVIPYNIYLLKKYQAHINVEICNRTRSVKYLFKYINKGKDRAIVVVEENLSNDGSSGQQIVKEIDEVKNYLDCRYISASEACWRIFNFDIQYRKPSVERLSFHLPGEQPVCFRDEDDLEDVISRPDVGKTKFTEWLVANQMYEDARELTYLEFPTKWVWHDDHKTWTRRKKGKKIGRIYFAHPTSGERFYLRMLLNIRKGPRSFEEIRTVEGVLHPTFKAACMSLGLLDDDSELHEALQEASYWSTGSTLREMFVTMLIFSEVTDPLDLWNKNWELISEDILHRQRNILKDADLQLSDDQIKNCTLCNIERIMNRNNRSMKEFPTLPLPNMNILEELGNRLIRDELNYDHEVLQDEFQEMHAELNPEQKKVFDAVTQAVENKTGGQFFVYGSGGTGKTYLWKTIISLLRSKGKIVIAVASSGVAALLLPGGRTAHSRLKIPITLDENSCCDIKQKTHLAELICKADLIIWDEAPMVHRHAFEALDRTLRDLMRFTNSVQKVFGGKTLLLGGDFRQILPVIPKGGRNSTVDASINKSDLWTNFKVFTLTTNMRLLSGQLHASDVQSISEFSKWVLDLGDGKLNAKAVNKGDEPTWIEIPNDLLIDIENEDDGVEKIVATTYPNLMDKFNDREYLRERCILAPTNESVDDINNYIISTLPGELEKYLSADTISPISGSFEDQDTLYPTEFLNTLQFPGIPNHELHLKVGIPIMLLRNINQAGGLCNGTRLIVTKLAKRVIQAEIVTGNNIGTNVLIPRIIMSPPNDSKWPFVLRRKQFPVKVCFAMTINKSQGQSLKKVGIYLPRPIFSHGQLYVAVSRTTSRDGIKILIQSQPGEPKGCTQNIVYKEVFQNLLSTR